MKKILFVVLLFFCLAVNGAATKEKQCRPAKHAKVPAITGLTYPKARKILLSVGWQPLQTKSPHEGEMDPDISSGNGPLFWQRGYVELQSCAGTGLAPCTFLLKDAYGNRLRVNTAGEELPEEKAHALVTRVQIVCDKIGMGGGMTEQGQIASDEAAMTTNLPGVPAK